MKTPSTSPGNQSDSTPDLEVGRLRDAFADAWKQGQIPQLEDYLAKADPTIRTVLLRELILVDCHHRKLRGEKPRMEHYASRFPEVTAGWLGSTTLVDSRAGLLPERYEVIALLGVGGMGAVYRVRDQRLDREVAVKVINSDFVGQSSHQSRFLREAKVLAAINNDYVVKIYDCDENKQTPYLVMELLHGESLSTALSRQERLPVDEVKRLAADLCHGLTAVHAQGLIHRDLKPSNVWLEWVDASSASTWTRAKVLDFGLARSSLSNEEVGEPITPPGALFGTPGYMSPEQVNGQELDARSDLFSLGCVLYEAVTGVRAFSGSTRGARLNAVCNHTPPAPDQLDPSIPVEFSSLVMWLLEKIPVARPPSATQFHQLVLDPITPATPPPVANPPRRPWMLWGILGVLLLSIVGAILTYRWQSDDKEPTSSSGRDSHDEEKRPSTTTIPPAMLAKDPDRAIARWALQRGAYEVSIAVGKDTWRDVRSVDKLPANRFDLLGIEFDGADLTDADLKTLASAKLPELQMLGFSRNKRLTDKGISHLSVFSLAGLDLAGCLHISDEGVKIISKHSYLNYLSLDGTSITDKGLPHLYSLKKLTELHIESNPGLTPAGVRALKQALKRVKIEEDTLTDS